MENKKTKIISIVAIVALALTVITATYAYFNASVGDPAATDIKINANTVDTFTFASGSAISFSINQDNFASGKGNITGSTYASAMLTANNKTNNATEHYYLYLNISDNTFTYSIDESTPEIIMTVTDSTGTEVTDISTLTHVIVTGANNTKVSGYDITNKNGLITLFDNKEITTTSNKEEKWNITITFVNYDASQNANAGKSMSAKVMIQKEEYKVLLADYVKSLYTGIQGENGIYYHDSSLTNGAGDSSYRYSGANPNNFVCFGSDATPCPTDNLYRIIGVFGNQVKLIKYDYATSALLGTDGDYQGTDTPNKSYYKGSLTIIDTYQWNYKATNSETNTWSTSLLNKTNLNINFLTNIGTEWANKIAETTWKVGGNTWENIGEVIPSTVYQNEINNPTPSSTSTTGETEYSAKIGLMYVSDYGFATEPSAWTTIMNSYYSSSITSVNWMYMGFYEWTISRVADSSNTVFRVWVDGQIIDGRVKGGVAIQPTFNLLSSITYAGGSGTQSDPIIIN